MGKLVRMQLVSIFLLRAVVEIYAQKEGNIWYFGNYAGISFATGAPTALTNGQLSTIEGCASVCDTAGNLLFYTDGIRVWNRYHTIMSNGSSLSGNPSSTQSAVIVRKPGSFTLYYIFTADFIGGTQGINCYEVDMTLNGGLGDVNLNTSKYLGNSYERITAVRHCNNRDVWIVTHDFDSYYFRTYLVTSAGVNLTPVTSSVPHFMGGFPNNAIGYLKASPNGKKLACAIYKPSNYFMLYSFDNQSGKVTNCAKITQSGPSAYGVEFSPDNTKLYCCSNRIFQYNLCLGSDSVIATSGIEIGNSPGGSALQLGPDKKIYVAKYGYSWLGVINNPNAPGTACNYVDNGVSLAGKNCTGGLPNIPSYYFIPPANFSVTTNCLKASFKAPQEYESGCSGTSPTYTSNLWMFGDPLASSDTSSQKNPSHLYSAAGSYSVHLLLFYPCHVDTVAQVINVSPQGFITGISGKDSICAGLSSTLTANAIGSYTWNTGESTQGIVVTPSVTSTYSVMITNTASCTYIGYKTVTVKPYPVASISCKDTVCRGSKTSISANGGTNYLWNNGIQQPAFEDTLHASTCYSVIVSLNGCNDTASKKVMVLEPPKASISGPDSMCYGDVISLTGNGGTYYQWSNGDTKKVTAVSPLQDSVFKLVVSNGYCTDMARKKITVNFPRINTISSTRVDEVNYRLDAGPAAAYDWSPKNEVSCSDCRETTVSPLETSSYCVITTDENGCRSNTCTTLTVSSFFIPNTFTPNGDLLNDVFRPSVREVSDYSFSIYNRLGEKIFETKNPQEGWEGSFRGQDCSEGIYVYKISFELISSGEKQEKTGQVMLLR